jgi:tetratricopeptide (TPR) repeat protein
MEHQRTPQETSSLTGPKNWEEALGLLQRVIEKKPQDRAVLLEKAHLLFRLGFYRECHEICKAITDDGNKRWEFSLLEAACENWMFGKDVLISRITHYIPLPKKELHKNLSSILSVFCDMDDAIFYLTNVLEREKDAQMWYLLACLQRAGGVLKDALTSLEKALAIAKDFVPAAELKEKIKVEILRAATKAQKTGTYTDVSVSEAKAGFSGEDWLVRGLGNMRDKNFTEALKSFAEALKCDPNLYVCWYYVGKVQMLLGGGEKAKQCFKKFIEGFPHSSGFYRTKIAMMDHSTKREEMENLYHRWIGFFPQNHESWMAYLKYLVTENDLQSARLLALEILDNYIAHWFLSISSPEFYNLKGLLELFVGRPVAARDSFSQALKMKNSDSIALLGLGKSNEELGNNDEALKLFEKLSKVKNSRILGLYLLASLFAKKKDKATAISYVEEAQKNIDNSLLLKSKRAEILLETGDLNGFMVYCTNIDRKDNPSIPIKLLKSVALYRVQKFNDAILDLEEARGKDPSNTHLLLNLGILYCRIGNYEKALRANEDLRKLKNTEAEFFLRQGIYHYFLKDYNESRQFLESYMNLCPLDHRLWSFLAMIEYSQEQYDMAEICFRKARDLSGGHYYACLNLAIFYCERGGYAKSLELLEKMQGVPAGALFHLCRARDLRGMNNLDEASKSINEVVRLEGRNITALFLKGLIEFERGEYQQSYDSLNKVLEQETGMAEFWYSQGLVSIYCDKSSQALEAINQALSLKPDYYEAWLGKAVLYWSLNNLEDAEKALKGAQNLRPDIFGEWLRYASTQVDHRSTIRMFDKISIPFQMPVALALDIEDPISTLHYLMLDNVFSP